jgi:DNA-binding beta-propeller fold protein YncE
LNVKQQEAKTLKKDIELTKKYASSVQILMGTRQLQEPVSSLEKYIQVAYDNGRFNQTEIEFKMDEQLNTITKDINEFGKISQKGDQTLVRLNWRQEKAAQILTLKQRTIDDVVLRKVQQIALSGNIIKGCTIMKNGNKLFTEYYSGQVLKYGSNGQLISKLEVKDSSVFDITAIDNSNIAVSSCGYGHKIHLIDVDRLQLTGSIDTGSYMYGITCHGGSLIYCTHSNGIRSFNMSTRKSIEIIPGSKGEFMYTYITSDNNYIYHSNHKTNSVVCYDFNGVKKWCYSSDLLKEPKGITVDSNSNIYVAGCNSHDVVVISPDGKRAKQLLVISDGIEHPCALCYDKDRNHLLVVSHGGSANLYEVSSIRT